MYEADVNDASGFRDGQVLLRRESAVEGHRDRRAPAAHCFEPIDHRRNEGHVGGVSVENHAVQDERRRAAAETNLVAEERVAVVFADDVRVLLEDRDDLLARGNNLLVDDPALSLGENALRRIKDRRKLTHEAPELRGVVVIGRPQLLNNKEDVGGLGLHEAHHVQKCAVPRSPLVTTREELDLVGQALHGAGAVDEVQRDVVARVPAGAVRVATSSSAPPWR